MRDLLLLVYCVAVGFVSAGIAASFYKLVTAEPARFGVLSETLFGLATSFIFCALTGPVIVIDFAIRNRRAERMPVRWLMAGVGVADEDDAPIPIARCTLDRVTKLFDQLD